MNRPKLNYIIDFFLFISFLIVSATGVMLFFMTQRRGNMAWLHDWSGMVMIVLGFVHLVLHWKWIVCMTKNIFKK